MPTTPRKNGPRDIASRADGRPDFLRLHSPTPGDPRDEWLDVGPDRIHLRGYDATELEIAVNLPAPWQLIPSGSMLIAWWLEPGAAE